MSTITVGDQPLPPLRLLTELSRFEPGVCDGDVNLMEVNLPEQAIIHFENVSHNETFAYSLISVRGFVSVLNPIEPLLFVHQLRNGVNFRELRTHIKNGRFTIILQLDEGRNEFRFLVDNCECCRCTFLYRPVVTENVVMPMFIQCRIDDENANDDTLSWLTDMRDRIILGCRLLQTIVAETLHQSGFGRRTFSLEQSDANSNDGVVVFNSELRWDAVVDMKAEKLWEHLGREIMISEYGHKNRKFLAFLSSSSKNEYSQHLAIGGGGLALCDAKFIRTWPAALDDFNLSLNSDTALTENNFGASLGAVCHELCHMFDLGHTINGIMGKDFDRVCALFAVAERKNEATRKLASVNFTRSDSLVVCEGAMRRKLNINFSVNDKRNTEVQDDNEQQRELRRRQYNSNYTFGKSEFWFGGCATLLAYHRWINIADEGTTEEELSASHLHYDPVRCIVTSVHGIIVVQLRNSDGYILKYWEFCELRKKKIFLVPVCFVRRSSNIVIEDTKGNLLKRDIESVL